MLGWDRGVRFGSPHEGLVDGYGVCIFFYESVADPTVVTPRILMLEDIPTFQFCHP
jgi:hypothetical protein